MAFIPSPTPLWVHAQAVDGNLRFLGTTTVLLRYLKHTRIAGKREREHDRDTESAVKGRAKLQCGIAPGPVVASVKAWRTDGKTEIDAELFHLQDFGLAAPLVANRAEIRAAQLTFRGDHYSALYGDTEKRLSDAKAQALFEAFLEHETIQIQARIGERETSTLVLKLGLIYPSDRR